MSGEEKPAWQHITEDGNFPEVELEYEEENTEEEEHSEYSETELAAMEKGWVPEDQWNGNPEDWRPAKEYMDRSSFFERISNQNREISSLKRDLELAKEHLFKIRQAQVEGSRDTLEAQKLAALEEENYARVSEIDKRLRQLDAEEQQPQQAPQQQNPEADPLFVEWVSDNPWYNTDAELRSEADAFGISYRTNNPDASPEDVFNYVTRQVRKFHPEKFEAPRGAAQTRSPGQATTPTARKGAKNTYRDLNEEQLRVGRRFVKLGVFKDIQDYVDDLVKLGEL